MIQENQVEAALDYIRDNASKYADAKANRIYLEQFRKSKKAILIQETQGTVQDRESYAYSHPEYQELLEGLKQAVAEEEKLKWMLIAAQTKIDVWRTQEASKRGGM